MISALVVYESIFGNAGAIARAVAAGLGDLMTVEVVDVVHAPTSIDPGLSLLVVGGPNHQFGMTRPVSREQAVRDFGAAKAAEVGMREWLGALAPPAAPVPAVAFDTRLDHPPFLRHLDHASRGAERLLRRRGFSIVVPAEHFFVVSPTGPLADGEADRAAAWGRTVAGRIKSD